MKILMDTELQTISVVDKGIVKSHLYGKESFKILSDLWLKIGWELKYPYTFSWLGFPILQIPEDMMRMQEVIVRLKPDIIFETGIAHGGSLIYYASLCKMLGHGEVIGVEKGLRCRKEVNEHPLAELITMIEGDSVSDRVVKYVHKLCAGKKVLVILDSNHSRAHVTSELNAYHDMIQPGSYIVATDGNMKELAEVPRGNAEWAWDNPQDAAKHFAATHPEFVIEQPPWTFNESQLTDNITYWPSAWLRRI